MKFLTSGTTAFILFILLSGLFVFNAQSQNHDYREKIYLHTDKCYYTAGDYIWFKAYLVDGGSHKPKVASRVMYVELINPEGEIMVKHTLKVKDGGGAGDFHLPIDLTRGTYFLRAYTRFMQNFDQDWFFQKEIRVNSVREYNSETEETIANSEGEKDKDPLIKVPKPNVRFFPEGGDLVTGFLNRVGVKVLGANGKGLDLKGSIFDDKDKKVIDFSTQKFGIGSFNFVPEEDKEYMAKISLNGNLYEYRLPESKKRGAILRVIDEDTCVAVIVRSSFPGGVKDFSLTGLQRNTIINRTEIASNKPGIKIKVPKDELSEGIIQFTLFDKYDVPVCERLFFVESKPTTPPIKLSVAKSEYTGREEVKLRFDTTEDTNISANLSLSVASLNAYSETNERDIRTHLLVNSELRGEVENPGFYFYSDHPKRKEMLDQLMMTQGWRRYVWKEREKKDSELLFEPETSLSVKGRVSRLYNRKKWTEANIHLTCSTSEEFLMYETNSNKDGYFTFSGLAFSDSSIMVVQAKKSEGPNAKMNYHITMDSLISPVFEIDESADNSNYTIFDNAYPETILTEAEIDSMMRLREGDIWLDEIVVKANKIDRQKEKRTHYFEPNYSVDFEEIREGAFNMNVLDAIAGRYAGSTGSVRPISMTQYDSEIDDAAAGPLYLLDGVPVRKSTIVSLPIHQVDFVDILKGAKASIYGSSTAPGRGVRPTVIAVYTITPEEFLNDKNYDRKKGIVTFTHPGFFRAREFYSPTYSSHVTNDKPDKRTTLFWEPQIRLNEEESGEYSFYTGDLKGKYKIQAEGITSDGKEIVLKEIIEVK